MVVVLDAMKTEKVVLMDKVEPDQRRQMLVENNYKSIPRPVTSETAQHPGKFQSVHFLYDWTGDPVSVRECNNLDIDDSGSTRRAGHNKR